MRLLEYLEKYALERQLVEQSVRKYRYSVRNYCVWLGQPAELSDATAESLNRFTAARQEQVRPRTARNDRDNLVMLVKCAAEDGLCPPIGKVRRPKVPPHFPVAWTEEEMRRLREAAGMMPAPRYWETLVDATYETCLRMSDVIGFDMRSLRPDGSADIVQQKTQQTHVVSFRPETLAAMRELGGRYPLDWPRSKQKEFYLAWKRLRELANLPSGGMQQIRRTAATFTEAAQPGMASRLLGHRTPGLDKKSYVDPRIAGAEPVQPPVGWRNRKGAGDDAE